MNIGIDIDGVILDFERMVRAYAELYDCIELNGNGLKNKNEHYFENRYNWNEQNLNNFKNKYFLKLSEQSNLMPCAKEVINLLKQKGHKLIIISARGNDFNDMQSIAENILKKEKLCFDKYYWKQQDKLEVVLKEKVDIMIDDSYEVCKKLSSQNIKVIYFRDKSMKEINNNNVIEVDNWGEIYKILNNISASY